MKGYMVGGGGRVYVCLLREMGEKLEDGGKNECNILKLVKLLRGKINKIQRLAGQNLSFSPVASYHCDV
jgi:hypothetical protein